ncbi:esterase-like activity of phytase family protein [Hyphomonas sp. WL0036]|uniref:esterase-like activity of phytase family protein n=1 Tax=Hyphomonas sediminis TaxID=2866160 RepID=UPI001C81FD3B|nr:esterase-like activity of phytase family protein [Hyphomonas sediminis]MBY9066912.1 esterase-like activity of phytase family protein [Hyphomonas sediminis]
MRSLAALSASLSAILIATCASPQDVGAGTGNASKSAGTTQSVPKSTQNDTVWRLSDHQKALTDRSCPAGTRRQEPLPLDISATAVSLGEEAQIARRIPANARLSGAWELSSSNSNFGGLSGLALLPDGGLLSVSDTGIFFWIDLADGAPSGGKIAYMQGANGKQLTGKTEGDAEGLVWAGGVALVSFERSFRIEAFALDACGSAARAAQVSALPDRHNGRKIDENQGPEALFLTPDGALGFGYEGMLSVSPLGRVLADGTSEWAGQMAPAPALHGLVGREIVALPDGTERTFELFRAWDPVQGNRIRLQWGTGEDEHLTLTRPLLVDNFEGIAAQALGNNEVRVWIVSDNNYSDQQRTLLYSFDVKISQN